MYPMTSRGVLLLASVISLTPIALAQNSPSLGGLPVAVLEATNPQYCLYETAVVSNSYGEVAVGAIARNIGASTSRIEYGVSVNFGRSYASGVLVPTTCLGPEQGGDPMVASNSSEDLYFGGLTKNGGSSHLDMEVYLRRKQRGQPLDPNVYNAFGYQANIPNGPFVDKQLMAIGPDVQVPGSPERAFVTYTQAVPGLINLKSVTSSDAAGTIWAACGVDASTAVGLQDPQNDPDRFSGKYAAPVVLTNYRRGRIVVAFCHEAGSGLPAVTVRSHLTGLWSGRIDLPAVDSSNTTIQSLTAVQRPLPGSFSIASYPAPAANPTFNNQFFVAFAAVATTDPTNTDLFVARSQDGGESYSALEVLRITDAMLGDTPGTDQFMPWIYVDQWGGVNLLYYRATTPDSVTDTSQVYLDAYYARIYPFTTSSPNIAVRRLTQTSFRGAVPPGASNSYVGDYQMLHGAKCNVYAAYMSTRAPDQTERYTIYVQNIRLCPPADVDSSGLIDGADLMEFGAAYVGNDMRADVDRNATLDARDLLAFQSSYSCGCTP